MNKIKVVVACVIVCVAIFIASNMTNGECSIESIEVDSICRTHHFEYSCKKPGFRLNYDDTHFSEYEDKWKEAPPIKVFCCLFFNHVFMGYSDPGLIYITMITTLFVLTTQC